MSAHFHAELGPFSMDVRLDDSGIHMQRGVFSQDVSWEEISGATLIRATHPGASEERDEQRIAQFLGPDAVQKIAALRGTVGEIVIAYPDRTKHVREMEIPAPLNDPDFLQEFETHLGNRWLAESGDRQQAAKRLHTNPGIFPSIFVLLALFGVAAVFAAIALLGFLGPILNFLSLQKMLLDLQDGNYGSLVSRLASYLALFVIGYMLHRVIRGKRDSFRGRL
jgi:hypothetical protein